MSLEQIRIQIDEIDRQIIALVARRNDCVRQVVDHKRSVDDIHVPEREAEVLANVRRLAIELGADVEVVERIYRTLLAAFVDFEVRHKDAEGKPEPIATDGA